jgi:hypothetical protein
MLQKIVPTALVSGKTFHLTAVLQQHNPSLQPDLIDLEPILV